MKEASFEIEITRVLTEVTEPPFVSPSLCLSVQAVRVIKTPHLQNLVRLLPGLNSRVVASGDWLKTSSFLDICLI